MKTSRTCPKICLFTALVIIGVALGSCSHRSLSSGCSDRTIKLFVDVEGLTQENVKDKTSIDVEDFTQNSEDHVTLVIRDSVLQWVGKPRTSSTRDRYSIFITKIKFENYTNVLRSKKRTNRSKNPFVVRGRVKRKESVIGKEEKYSIEFQVYKNYRLHGIFTLDPKLKVIR